MWQDFCDILQELLAIHTQLLQLSNAKKDALVEVDVPRIEEITKQEETIIIEVGKLEKMRRTMVMQLAKKLNLAENECTITTLIECADNDIKPKLAGLNKQLNEVLVNLKHNNDINTKLIEQSLTIINFNINVMTQSTTGPVYAAGGKQQVENLRGFFDKKV